MRAVLMLTLLPLLAACEAQPAPEPTPLATADPEVLEAEVDRREIFMDDARTGDFDVRFAEPFVSFDVRGGRIGISESGTYRVVDAQRSRDKKAYVFRAEEGLAQGEEPFVLTIVPQACRDAFSRERTAFTAFLGTEDNPQNLRSCAAPAK